MPSASSVPVSRVRFSIVNWNSNEMSITAEAIRKKLKLMNNPPKSIELLTESSAWPRMSRKAKPVSAGVSSLSSARPSSALSVAEKRMAVRSPKRLLQISCPEARLINALGVPLYSSQ